MSRTCTKCNVEQPLESYYLYKYRGEGKYFTACKSCCAVSSKEHYRKSESRREKQKLRNEQERDRKRKFISEYLSTHPCEHCGESDPIVLEFDHIDRSSKSSGISELKGNTGTFESLVLEVSKCRVLCANCHRRHTYAQFGWTCHEIT